MKYVQALVKSYSSLSPRIKRFGLASLILLASIVAVFFFCFEKTSMNPMDESYWKDRIHSVGGKSAYAEFGLFEEKQPVAFRHKLSHMFGSALYAEMGPSSLYVCDFKYESGCLHEFFRQFAKKFGTSSLVEMAKECATLNGSPGLCEHAIGHGLLVYFGNNEKGLQKALTFCGESFTGDPVLGCTGGVFMEYNGYTLLDGSSRLRDVGSRGWYDPCLDTPDSQQRSCTWWLVRWWNEKIVHMDAQEEGYKKMGELCRGLPHQVFRRECFEATGQKVASTAHFDVSKIKSFCAIATTNPADNLYCLSYAAAMFITSNSGLPDGKMLQDGTMLSGQMLSDGTMMSTAELKTQEKAREVCADLGFESKKFCTAYANNQNYLYNELPLPASVK